MKTRAGRGLLLIIASVGLWCACSSHKTSPIPNTRCSDQNPCKEPLTCIDGFCKQTCTDQAQCPDEMTCSYQGYCATPCQSKDDCADDEKCFAGVCEPVCIDIDQDGFGKNCRLGDDCDDNDFAIHPGALEICGDGKDNNCNGQTDEPGCSCTLGMSVHCYTGPAGTEGIGICHGGKQTCGSNDCVGEQTPQTKKECYGEDYNCDGVISTTDCGTYGCDPDCQCATNDPVNGCECKLPKDIPCYPGPIGTLGVGECRNAGKHSCILENGTYVWTPCIERDPQHPVTVPVAEICGDNKDNDCDGVIDNGCDNDGDGYSPPADCDENNKDVHPGAVELCDGLDNNCDGRIDEYCGCSAGASQQCYHGPVSTVSPVLMGNCDWGQMTCLNGEFWSECIGEKLPQPEDCNFPNSDLNCDGTTAINSLQALHPKNACGSCAENLIEICNYLDDNCNGLIDEGTIQACGTCPDQGPCYEKPWDDPGLCNPPPSGQICDDVKDQTSCCVDEGIETSPCDGSNNCITLKTAQNIEIRYLWVSIWNHNEVAKVDTTNDTVQLFSTHGTDPSRTAVAEDKSVWVANRCRSGSYNSPTCSNVVHIDSEGRFMCRGDVTGMARGLAIDYIGEGTSRVWAGNTTTRQIYRFDGTLRNSTDCNETNCDALYQAGGCCCKLIDTIDVSDKILDTEDGVYGMAFDGRYMWTASNPTLRIDATTTPPSITVIANPSFYGIAVDHKKNVWIGDAWHDNAGLRKINSSDNTVINLHSINSDLISITGITVDSQGFVWANRNEQLPISEKIFKIHPDNNTVECFIDRTAIPNMVSHGLWGIAEGASNTIWITPQTGDGTNVYAYVLNSDCTSSRRVKVDDRHGGTTLPAPQLYTYSDMTGSQLMYVIKTKGRWIQYFDSGYLNPVWDRAQFEAIIPASETSISLSLASADTKDALSPNNTICTIPFNTISAVFTPYTADLTAQCPGLPNKRWLLVVVTLSTAQGSTQKPELKNLDLSWTRILSAP